MYDNKIEEIVVLVFKFKERGFFFIWIFLKKCNYWFRYNKVDNEVKLKLGLRCLIVYK